MQTLTKTPEEKQAELAAFYVKVREGLERDRRLWEIPEYTDDDSADDYDGGRFDWETSRGVA